MKDLDGFGLSLDNFPEVIRKSFLDNDLEKGRKPAAAGTVDKYGYVKQSDGSWKKPKKDSSSKEETPPKKNDVVMSEKAQKLLLSMKEALTLPIRDVNYDTQPEHVKELISAGLLKIDKKHRDLVYVR